MISLYNIWMRIGNTIHDTESVLYPDTRAGDDNKYFSDFSRDDFGLFSSAAVCNQGPGYAKVEYENGRYGLPLSA